MNLSELSNGSSATIVGISGDTTIIKRLVEMGFVKGREIKAIKNAPLRDPVEYELMGYNISLRRQEAESVQIVTAEESRGCCKESCPGSQCGRVVRRKYVVSEGENVINVAVVGNPNSGKTTLYNSLAGQREHTGNYAGVTVGHKTATIHHSGYKINITDLPGIYSLSNNVAEEKVVGDVLSGGTFDFVINVLDSTLLERNLFLTTQLMDMGQHVVVALNMYDELLSMGDKFDYQTLSRMLDIPFIPTVASKGEGALDILDVIVKRYSKEEEHTHIESNMGETIESALASVASKIRSSGSNVGSLPSRFVASMLLDNVAEYSAMVNEETLHYSYEVRQRLEGEYGEKITPILANARYGYIAGALRETHKMSSQRHKRTKSIDNVLTHRVWGLPIFVAILWVMFYSVYTLGEPLQDLIDMGVGWLSDFMSSVLPNGAIQDLVVDGMIGGVGSVIVFLPNILILFLFIAFLEDSGYMARAAFIMDKLMHKIGLHGKSFIPLLMGFGCNVPAIMATRIIEERKSRLVTMLILPFMSCSARLPVYILLVGAFFPENAVMVLLGLYLLGILLAIVSSLIFRKVLFTQKDQPFVMELPPYRFPTFRAMLKHMWEKGGLYLKKMGGVILIGSVVIWALSYYPSREDSYLKSIGQTIEPVIEPLGFDWRMGVSLVSGIAAKEVVIGTMGVIYNTEEGDDLALAEALQEAQYSDGSKIFTLASTLSFLAFVLIYFPCIAVVSAIRRESGGWKWALFSVFYTTGLAWVISYCVYNIFS
ncbi:MAG: ferrous iron transport protein B [Rikenellaceae bacterium]